MSEDTETEALSTAFEQYKKSRSKLERLLSDVTQAYTGLESLIPQVEGTCLDVGQLLLSKDDKTKITRTFQDPSIIFVGQTNAGKSSLINEVLGATVVKADDTPCTSRMVELSYGDNQYPVVQIQDKDGNLLEEVVMKKNFIPSGVANLQEKDRDIDRLIKSKVTAKINIPFLKSGVKIIDSPGKNENEQLDQMVDEHMNSVLPLIVYVIDGRTLLTTEEVKDISALRNSVPEGNIFFAITKCDPEDKVESDESDEEDDTEPVDLTVRSKLEVEIHEGVYRKLIDEGILERKPMSECRKYHTLSSRRVKMYRWALKKAQTDETRQTIAECTRHMQDFRRFKSSLLEFTREQLIKSITDAAKILQYSLMTCLDYFIEQSNNIFYEKLENEENMKLIEVEEFLLSQLLMVHVKGTSSVFTDAIEDVIKNHKTKIIEAACDFKFEMQFKIPESGFIARGSVEEYKEALRKEILNNVCTIIHREVMSKCDQLDQIFDDVSKNVKRVQDKIKGEIPIHDALQAMFISNYTFDIHKAKLTKSIWQKIWDGLVSCVNVITFKPVREAIKGVNVTSKQWKEGIAREVLDVVRPSNVADIIIKGIVQHISQGHANFTSRLLDLRELYAKNALLGERDRILIRKMAPIIGRLHLISWNIIDRLRFGEIKYGKVRGKGAQGVVQDCDAVGPSGEACVAKIIKVENDNELGELALEVHYCRKLSHKNIANVYGTLVDKLMPGNMYEMFIIMPRLACDLLEALPAITDIKARLNIALQTADALHYIHDRKMMHRDIKAANILLDTERNVMITDFGLCKPPGICDGSFVGTPVHMAPEIIKQLPYSAKVDVYAFGILLWYICEGQGNHPRYVCNHRAVQGLLLETAIGRRPEKLASFREDCWELMERCWREEPILRPDMTEVLKSLTSIVMSL